MMIERLVYSVLTSGIAALKAEPDALIEFFEENAELSHAEAVAINDIFRDQPPSVIHGYAKGDSPFPVYAVITGGDSPRQHFIGDSGGFDQEEGESYAIIRQYTYPILCYTRHPDLALYYGHLAHEMLVANIELLKDDGCFDIDISQMDMAPDPALAPAGLFLRRITVAVSREYTQILAGSKLGRAFKVQGIHVDRAGDPGADVGGVPTHVTVEEPDADAADDDT